MTQINRLSRFYNGTGFTRYSVKPASRASNPYCAWVCPVSMMMGTMGFGLARAVRMSRAKSRPFNGSTYHSVTTISIGACFISVKAAGASSASRTRWIPKDRQIFDTMLRINLL